MSAAIVQAGREAALVHALERIGWELRAVEIDFGAGTARVELRRFDGRIVTLDARNGRATVTREHVRLESVQLGVGGAESRRGRFRSERLRTEFLGRSRCLGIRHGMRLLASYVAENATGGALPAGDVRAILAPVLDAATPREVPS